MKEKNVKDKNPAGWAKWKVFSKEFNLWEMRNFYRKETTLKDSTAERDYFNNHGNTNFENKGWKFLNMKQVLQKKQDKCLHFIELILNEDNKTFGSKASLLHKGIEPLMDQTNDSEFLINSL